MGCALHNGEGQFWLDSDQAGDHALDVRVRQRSACAVEGATEVASDEAGWRRYERPERLPPGLRSERIYVSDGACVTLRFEFDDDVNAGAMVALDSAVAFQPRATLADAVADRSGLVLCGAGAPPCTPGPK